MEREIGVERRADVKVLCAVCFACEVSVKALRKAHATISRDFRECQQKMDMDMDSGFLLVLL